MQRWSPFGDEGEENPCGVAEAEDEAYWYLGFTECFRANVAYSLYGVLKGEEDQGCNKHTFINSFLTTQGVEAFTQSVQAAGVVFTDDNSNTNNNGDDDENENEVDSEYPGGVTSQCFYEEDDDDANQEFSNGLGCSGKSFVQKAYKGTYCKDQSDIKVTDQLSSFNSEIQKTVCVQIYSREAANNNNNNENQDDWDSLDVLYKSRACDVRQFPKQCPDPYGKLRSYARASARATEKSNHPLRQMVKTAFSWIFLSVGLAFLGASFFIFLVNKRRNSAREKVIKGGERRDSGRRSTRKEDAPKRKDSRSNSRKADPGTEKNRKGFLKRIRSRLICKTDKEARNGDY